MKTHLLFIIGVLSGLITVFWDFYPFSRFNPPKNLINKVVASPPSTNPSTNPSFSSVTVYYSIKGATVAELRSQMYQFGIKKEASEQHFGGYTDWKVTWSYQTIITNHQCQLKAIQVEAKATIILPQWTPSPNASSSLKSQWRNFIKALKVHEQGHEQHGINAAQEIWYLLTHLSSESSCENLEKMATEAADAIIDKYIQEDIRYDQITQHGMTQGAVFP